MCAGAHTSQATVGIYCGFHKRNLVFARNHFTWLIVVNSEIAMLKRFSSLILALVIGGSVMAGTTRLEDEHVCQMAGMEGMPGMATMPCCKKSQSASVNTGFGSTEQCCISIPQETGSRGTTFNLRPPSFSVAVIHPSAAQSPLAAPKPYECSHSTEVFLPNLQASYIRNLSLLI
jgi:hypothetical protein